MLAAIENRPGNVRGIAVEQKMTGKDDVLSNADVFKIDAMVHQNGVSSPSRIDGRLDGRKISRDLANARYPIPSGQRPEDHNAHEEKREISGLNRSHRGCGVGAKVYSTTHR